MHTTTWMNPEHIMLSERSHHNLILHEAIHMKCPVRQICSDRSVRRHEKRKGYGVFWGDNENVALARNIYLASLQKRVYRAAYRAKVLGFISSWSAYSMALGKFLNFICEIEVGVSTSHGCCKAQGFACDKVLSVTLITRKDITVPFLQSRKTEVYRY